MEDLPEGDAVHFGVGQRVQDNHAQETVHSNIITNTHIYSLITQHTI